MHPCNCAFNFYLCEFFRPFRYKNIDLCHSPIFCFQFCGHLFEKVFLESFWRLSYRRLRGCSRWCSEVNVVFEYLHVCLRLCSLIIRDPDTISLLTVRKAARGRRGYCQSGIISIGVEIYIYKYISLYGDIWNQLSNIEWVSVWKPIRNMNSKL